jgi:hypothetical protein
MPEIGTEQTFHPENIYFTDLITAALAGFDAHVEKSL